jgi:hypothetical protein
MSTTNKVKMTQYPFPLQLELFSKLMSGNLGILMGVFFILHVTWVKMNLRRKGNARVPGILSFKLHS